MRSEMCTCTRLQRTRLHEMCYDTKTCNQSEMNSFHFSIYTVHLPLQTSIHSDNPDVYLDPTV